MHHPGLGLGLCLLAFGLGACGGGGASAPAAPTGLSYPTPLSLTVGVAMVSANPTVTGTVTSYSVSPALPAGLMLSTDSGQISGTPASPSASSPYVITAQNAGGAARFAVEIAVGHPTLAEFEPAGSTGIAVGQRIRVFFVQRNSAAPFPDYVDPTLVTWSSSNPARVAVSAVGDVTGIGEGSATITGQYRSFTLQLAVQVSGQLVARSLDVAGQGARRYLAYLPPGPTAGRPLLIALHGGTGTGMNMAATSRLVQLGIERGIVIAFPEGSGALQTFNAGACCGSAQAGNVDDVAFVRALIDDVRGRDAIDPVRVYATGFSNGGMMAHRLACALADRIAGVAPVGGGSGQFDRLLTQYYACAPTRPIPVLHIHGMNDRNYPYAGGRGSDSLGGTDFYGIEATLSDWLARNNLTRQSRLERVNASTVCEHFETVADAARASARVTLCRVDPPDLYDAATGIVYGGGHAWPGGTRAGSATADTPVTDFDASAYLWGFLDR
jgi:polyhydroxybutyrate depolymerase